ncbi:glycosyltransferase family 4 protein [Natrialbaceae archaeon AArc-T1-2]|uniref:glycosyltransferase family 4 protein n=1 Tax=Natrialbaceae archaeon AArc-T1-2 TaxID=3053904 RepID=UPI00255ACCF5|nr:glycosyltransferase family 4 protein [Natrialbaceae archaeon AArc-T1-2]WIV65933.1 glycosyltransferase family 4 protein [Natrialbaceae archaeon AArc-T1-2]
MHVGLVVYDGLEGASGGFRYDRRLHSHLHANGETVEVIELPWHDYLRALVDGLSPRVRTHLDRNVDVLLVDGLCHPSLWRHLDRLEGPDAVVALVHHLRGDDPTTRHRVVARAFERRYLESADAIVCTSAFTRDRARALAPGVGATRTLVAPPAGRAEGAAVSPDRVDERADEGPLRIVFVGSLIPRKDPKTVLSACARLEGVDWELTVVGSHAADPAYAADVLACAADLGIDDRLTVTGTVSDPALAAVLERSHVCCVPSRYEAFGMAYLEAMEYGVVPIASAVGGAGEFVTDRRDGFLLEPGDDRRIAAILTRLAADRDRLASLGRTALETARAHPTWDETLGDVRSFLRAVGGCDADPSAGRSSVAAGSGLRGGGETR